MNRYFVSCVVALSSASAWSQPTETAEVEVSFPLIVQTLAPLASVPEVGVIVVSDLADADKQVSTVLLQGLQRLGLLIESPPLDLDKFLLQNQQWRSNVVELAPAWISDHNRHAGAPTLPADRIYAVQYSGRYRYAAKVLKLVLAITLYERGVLGPFAKSTKPYSNQFFAEKLEASISSQLTQAKPKQ